MTGELVCIGTMIAEDVDRCTCGASAPYGHEQFCGLEPIQSISEADRDHIFTLPEAEAQKFMAKLVTRDDMMEGPDR